MAADSGKITQSMMPVPPNVVPEVAKGSRREKVLEVVNEYVEGKYRSSSATQEEAKTITLKASDIVLQPYLTEQELAKQASIPSSDSEAWYRRHSLNGFLSTPKFVMTLTDISLALIA